MTIKSKLQQQLQEIIKELFGTQVPFSVDVPENSEYGDYSTNAALVLAKPLGKSPREIGMKIAESVKEKGESYIDKVEIAGAGFINFYISGDKLFETLQEIEEKKESFGKSDVLSGTKVITEFTDPNPFKEFHIGHLYSNTVGEAISRLIESQGAQVRRVCYQGDIGLHVAKALWGIQKKIDDSQFTIDDLEQKSLNVRAKFLGEAYAIGATAYEESEDAKKEIIEINKKVFAKDPVIIPLYEQGKAWSLEYFNALYSRLGMQFDQFFMESEVGEEGRKLVLGYLDKGLPSDKQVFEESDGAVIFPGKKHGLHDRVFINSLGLPTYEAKELGLAPAKYEYFPYDQSVIITGNEITEYFKVLLKALSLIRPELAEKTLHIGHGMVRLPEGKMSSRTGNVVTGEWLLDEAKVRAGKKMQESPLRQDFEGQAGTKKQELETRESEGTSEAIGIAAVKYALLKNGIGGDIAFSFDESISFEGNAGPYLQYTYVRTQSVLAKVKGKGKSVKVSTSPFTLNASTLSLEELSLLRHLIHFPEIVAYAASVYSPNLVCEYLYQLAQKFNLFYAKHKIIAPVIASEAKQSSENISQAENDTQEFRIGLTQAVGQVMKNGLTLLGIPTVEKM